MSNVIKGNFVEFNTDEKLFISSGRLMNGEERRRMDEKDQYDEKMRSTDAKDNAETVLKHAIIKAQGMIMEAQDEARTAIANAKEQGYNQGYEAAFKQAFEESEKEAVAKRQPAVEAIQQLEQLLTEEIKKYSIQEAGMEQAFEYAKKIIETELKNNSEAFLSLYKKAASHVGNAEKIVLRSGPHSCATAEANRQWIEKQTDGLQCLEIQESGEDNGLCILETSLGNVDASVNVQMERVKSILNQT